MSLLDDLVLVNRKRNGSLDLADAITGQPGLTLTIDGASTLEVAVNDGTRRLIRSDAVQMRSWARAAGVRWELVGIRKAGDQVTLTFEDAIVAALRRHDSPLAFKAGSTTRRAMIERLAHEAHVPAAVDPAKRPHVARAVHRSKQGDAANSWDLLGNLADEVQWRRFSDGHRLVVGSDDWLISRDNRPTRVREHTGAVQDIDFNLDTGRRASTATLYIDAALWTLPPGSVVLMGDDMGPAEGRWLVTEYRRPIYSSRATVQLARRQHELKEPKRVGRGDRGELGYIPSLDSGSDGNGKAATAARERMVQFALSKKGNPYQWGGHGPVEYDCSGLVQAATSYAGHTLPAPSSSQAAAIARAGKSLTVDQAIRTRGALLFRIGTGTYNHVAISLGNGSTIEAMGEAYGVCIGGTAGRGWTSGGWWI